MTSSSWSYSYLFRLPLGISTRHLSGSSPIRIRAYRRRPPVESWAMSRARIAALAAVVGTQLVAAAPALAKNGEGLVGETNDKVITMFCLGLVCFFILVVIVGTIVQTRLER